MVASKSLHKFILDYRNGLVLLVGAGCWRKRKHTRYELAVWPKDHTLVTKHHTNTKFTVHRKNLKRSIIVASIVALALA